MATRAAGGPLGMSAQAPVPALHPCAPVPSINGTLFAIFVQFITSALGHVSMAFRDVVLCFTMLNGQMPFVCFLFNSVFVRTIFSEAALINNGCAAHVRALLIFYSAAAPNALSALLRR